MQAINLKARLVEHPIDTANYQWIKLTAPVYGTYPRGTTGWEQKCLNTVNNFLERLFSVPGFRTFFTANYCRVTKKAVLEFLEQAGSKLTFPDSREYQEPFSSAWCWCQLEGGANAQGHIMDRGNWLYDKLAVPDIVVTIDGIEYKPFNDIRFFSTCVDDYFAWDLCESSAYNVPYLYAIVRSHNNNIEELYEGGFSADEDKALLAVLNHFDQHILSTYNIIIENNSIAMPAGVYPMHFFDTKDTKKFRELIRNHKKEIFSIIESVNKKN